MDTIFVKTLTTLLWDFLNPPSQANLNFFLKTGIHHFYDVKLYGEKQKKLMIQRSCIADKWKNK